MKRLSFVVGVIGIIVLAAGRGAGAQGNSGAGLEIGGAAPGSALEIALNGGKIADAIADEQGEAVSVLDLSNFGKVRVSVFVDRCENGRTVKVQLVTAGSQEPPKDEGCDRKPAGFFWSDKGRIVLDVSAGTVSTPGISKALLIGGGAAAAAGIGLAAGGGSDTPPSTGNPPTSQPPTTINPAGNYQVSITKASDPGEHERHVALAATGVLSITGSRDVQIAGPNLQNWVPVSGTFDASTGRFTATGRGTVAGFANVSVRFEGTINSSGALTGTLTMGGGGELPGGQPITYTVQGQK